MIAQLHLFSLPLTIVFLSSCTYLYSTDANRGDRLTLDILKRRWVTFWLATALEAGAPTVTSPAYDDDVEAWLYERPFSQPLGDIREYFGESVALYFAWLGYYSYMCSFPAILGW